MLPSTRHCPSCAAERLFEQPPCLDGHGLDCPEWICIECGGAFVFGAAVEIETVAVTVTAA